MADASIVLCGFVIAWCLMISFRLMVSKQLAAFSKVNASIKATAAEHDEHHHAADIQSDHHGHNAMITTTASGVSCPHRALQVLSIADP